MVVLLVLASAFLHALWNAILESMMWPGEAATGWTIAGIAVVLSG